MTVLERSRARGFRNALQQRRLNLRTLEQRRALSTLETNERAYGRAVATANDTEQDSRNRESARAQMSTLQSQRVSAYRAFAAAAPELAIAFQTDVPDVEALRARIPEDAAYVAYSLGESDAMVFALRPGMPAMARHIPGNRASYAERVHALRALIASPGGSQQSYLEQSAALYGDLIEPITPLSG